MKTSDLIGELLDRWVLKAEGYRHYYGPWWIKDGHPNINIERWAPSSDPAQGWPIIEREDIDIVKTEFGPYVAGFKVRVGGSIVNDGNGHYDEMRDIEMEHMQFGDSRLIAAMRARVTKAFGPVVPDA